MIQTVLGPISALELAFTLPHEHIFIDLRPLVSPPEDEAKRNIFYQKLSLANVGYTLNNPYAMLDNAVIDDYEVMVSELRQYKEAGGASIVDCTLRDIARDPQKLQRLSRDTGVNIITGCGYYISGSHPEYLNAKSIEDIAEEMYNEITNGMDNTDIKAGVIGEVGTSAEISENEWKTVRAAAIVHRQTGAGIHVHTSLWDANGLAVRDTLTGLGVPADKICINHIDVVLRYDYLVDLCNAGVMVEFDNFGKEYYINGRDRYYMKDRFAYDLERVEVIARLIADGYLDHILITNDICLKSLLHNYGGRGYDHILTNIIPMMEDLNITAGQINTICIKNPAKFLEM